MSILAGIGGFWFGVVAIIALIAGIIALSTRNFWTFILFVGLFFGFTEAVGGEYSGWAYITQNWVMLLEYGAIYIVAGFAWATLAWVIHLHKQKQKYSEVRNRLLPMFLTKMGVQELTPDLYEAFRKYVVGNAGDVLESTYINKGVLAEQVILWPIKIVAFFFGDAIRILVDGFVSLFGNFFSAIKRRMFREFSELEL